jgi:hypothetical protein
VRRVEGSLMKLRETSTLATSSFTPSHQWNAVSKVVEAAAALRRYHEANMHSTAPTHKQFTSLQVSE